MQNSLHFEHCHVMFTFYFLNKSFFPNNSIDFYHIKYLFLPFLLPFFTHNRPRISNINLLLLTNQMASNKFCTPVTKTLLISSSPRVAYIFRELRQPFVNIVKYYFISKSSEPSSYSLSNWGAPQYILPSK